MSLRALALAATPPWLFLVSTAVLIAALSYASYRSGVLLRAWTPPFNLLLSWPDAVARLILIAACLAVGRLMGPGAVQLGWHTRGIPRDLLIGLASGLLLFAALHAGGRLAIRRWGPQIYSPKMLACILPATPREWPLVALALIPAVLGEELLFRSLALGGTASWLDPAWLLGPLSLFFGALHWPQGAWGVVATTIAAATLGILFLATGSIWPPVAAHYALNLLQLALARRLGFRPLRGA